MLKGKKVLVPVESFDFHQFKQTSKALLFQDLQEQYEKLLRYGVQFCKKKDCIIAEESTCGGNNKPLNDVTKNETQPKSVERLAY